MAYTRKTIVKTMLEASGKSAEEVSAELGEDASYVGRIISGDIKKPTTNALNLIAKRCGYELAFVGHGQTLVLAAVDRPREYREFEGGETAGQNMFTGTEVAVTGALYGYTDDAQRALLKDVGATWVENVKTRTTDYLVIGSDKSMDDPTGQMKRVLKAKRAVTKMITAEEFRQEYLRITGRDISVE